MSAIGKLLSEAIAQRDAVCKALRPKYPEPMDILIGNGGFHARIEKLQIAAIREAEKRGLAAHLVPMIDELIEAHYALLSDAVATWDHFEDVDAGL